mmetsp:Transcript_75252/g.126623  ORF Transcript_75252/g.126623 Transcript_75252/m.126623 type:complete len:372 (+) Transcript_75252:1283-2398(+)
MHGQSQQGVTGLHRPGPIGAGQLRDQLQNQRPEGPLEVVLAGVVLDLHIQQVDGLEAELPVQHLHHRSRVLAHAPVHGLHDIEGEAVHALRGQTILFVGLQAVLRHKVRDDLQPGHNVLVRLVCVRDGLGDEIGDVLQPLQVLLGGEPVQQLLGDAADALVGVTRTLQQHRDDQVHGLPHAGLLHPFAKIHQRLQHVSRGLVHLQHVVRKPALHDRREHHEELRAERQLCGAVLPQGLHHLLDAVRAVLPVLTEQALDGVQPQQLNPLVAPLPLLIAQALRFQQLLFRLVLNADPDPDDLLLPAGAAGLRPGAHDAALRAERRPRAHAAVGAARRRGRLGGLTRGFGRDLPVDLCRVHSLECPLLSLPGLR